MEIVWQMVREPFPIRYNDFFKDKHVKRAGLYFYCKAIVLHASYYVSLAC